MTRLFVAAHPSTSVVARLTELPDLDEVGVRAVAPQNWHITLRFLGDVAAADVVDVTAALTAASLPPADVVLGPQIERLGRGQLVVPVAGADRLAAAVRTATAGLGQRDQHRFVGHLTVARTKHDAKSALFGHPVDAAMPIREVALIESVLEPTGAVYTTLATFPTD